MAGDEVQPKAHPSLNLPKSNSTVEVSIINTTTDIVVPAKAFVEPVQKGHEHMNLVRTFEATLPYLVPILEPQDIVREQNPATTLKSCFIDPSFLP